MLYEEQTWPALARCLHRLAGAAQIMGAARVEKHRHELEKYCESEPEADEVAQRLMLALTEVEAFNQAISTFID